MRMRVRVTSDVVAAALLVGAATVLLATPYDGGACRNVASAYGLPAASFTKSAPPATPAALATARQDVTAASSEVAGLSDERAAAERASEAAEQAREAAREAETKTWSTPVTIGSTSSAELDVELAESQVESAESWLKTVQDGAAETSEFGSIWTQEDVADAQEELDAAEGELAAAQEGLEEARDEDAASEAAAAAVERKAEQLAAAADAADKAAEQAASTLASAETAAEERLSSAKGRVARLEVEHDQAQDEWWHEQRVEHDEVVALNNVRQSCRENGGWRAGVALVDVVLLGALALRAWWPRGARLRLPSRPRLTWRLRRSR